MSNDGQPIQFGTNVFNKQIPGSANAVSQPSAVGFLLQLLKQKSKAHTFTTLQFSATAQPGHEASIV